MRGAEVDQLHNHGKPAFPKWKKAKNLRMKHSKFRGLTKYFRAFKNMFVG